MTPPVDLPQAVENKSETLQESIAKASEAVQEDGSLKVTETEKPAVVASTDPKDKSKIEETGETEELSELEISQSKELFKVLKDPARAPALIEYLAKEAGFSKVETKEEVIEAKDSILETLKENLGNEFDFLTPRLSKAISKILEEKLNEHTKDIRDNLAAEREAKIKVETTDSYVRLSQKFFGKEEMPLEIMTEMSKSMHRYKPAADMSVEDYLLDMLHTSASRLGVDLKNYKSNLGNKDRIERNRNDAIGRLASERGAITETAVIGSPQNSKLSLKESIALAARELETANKG